MEESEIEDAEEAPRYFFDTYGIVEILDGNPNYADYKDEKVTITVFNLAEIYYHSLLEYSEKEAEEIYNKYKDAVVEIDDEAMKEAMRFRKEHKKDKMSYTDCIGYICAKKHGLKFLTGDKEFEGMENVEFVK